MYFYLYISSIQTKPCNIGRPEADSEYVQNLKKKKQPKKQKKISGPKGGTYIYNTSIKSPDLSLLNVIATKKCNDK